MSVQADSTEFQFYKGGIFDSKNCGDKPQHTMMAIGYGTDLNGKDYYLLKNSWGKYWGEDGYMRIVVTEGKGTCGIQTQPYLSVWETSEGSYFLLIFFLIIMSIGFYWFKPSTVGQDPQS